MTLRTFGADRLGAVVEKCCAVARALAARVDAEPELERLAPVALNIVCFRFVASGGELDALNAAIVADLHEAGLPTPSTTTLNGRLGIRAAIVNHRKLELDIHALIDAVLRSGRARAAG